jgi:flavin-binding protein dodecin
MVEKSIELTGTSANSIEDAVSLAVSRAGVTNDGIPRADVIDISANIDDGSVARWRVKVKITCAVLARLHE